MNFQEFRKTFHRKLFDSYRVTIDLVDIAGGTPADPKMLEGWINATNKEKSAEDRAALVEATADELPVIAGEQEAKSWVRFKRDDRGPYIEGRCIKAALKECANIVKSAVKSRGKNGEEAGTKNLKSKMAECVFVAEEKIYITDKGGNPISGDVPTEERPAHVMTAQGPRTSIKRTDVLRDVRIQFTARLAKTGAVSEAALFAALSYLEINGIGADRSQGRGRASAIDVVQM